MLLRLLIVELQYLLLSTQFLNIELKIALHFPLESQYSTFPAQMASVKNQFVETLDFADSLAPP
jgi:hypothetical protein